MVPVDAVPVHVDDLHDGPVPAHGAQRRPQAEPSGHDRRASALPAPSPDTARTAASATRTGRPGAVSTSAQSGPTSTSRPATTRSRQPQPDVRRVDVGEQTRVHVEQRALPPGAVGDLRLELTHVVERELRLEVVEESVPAHAHTLPCPEATGATRRFLTNNHT